LSDGLVYQPIVHLKKFFATLTHVQKQIHAHFFRQGVRYAIMTKRFEVARREILDKVGLMF
jgi:hypothetical protein